MFWNKNKNKPDFTDNAGLVRSKTRIYQPLATSMDLRRAVLDWRDKHGKNAELHLAREITSLHNALDEQISKMGYKDFFFTSGKFGRECLEPIYRDWVSREVTYVMNAAQKDLYAVVDRALEYSEHSTAMENSGHQGHYADIAIAASATAAGLAAIPAVATFSMTSAGGVLGLLGVTVASFPVILFGTAMVGLLLALGGYKALGVRPRALSRYQKIVREKINKQVLGYDGSDDSVRHRLQSHITNTAENIIMEIDSDNTF